LQKSPENELYLNGTSTQKGYLVPFKIYAKVANNK